MPVKGFCKSCNIILAAFHLELDPRLRRNLICGYTGAQFLS